MSARYKLARNVELSTRIVCAFFAAAHVVHLFSIFFGRIDFPLDLEWEEGGMLTHALRVIKGEPIYASPSADFISFLYTPLYPVVLAGLGKLFGVTYLLGRLVSIASFAWICILFFLTVVRLSPQRFSSLWGVIGVGLICSTFPHSGGWYDLVRNDAFYLALVVTGYYVLAFKRHSVRYIVVAGVLLGCAFLAKQTAVLFIIYAGLALLIMDWRRLSWLVGTTGLVAGGGVLVGNWASDGWLWRYIYQMHQGHSFFAGRLWPEAELKLLAFSPAVFAAVGLGAGYVLVATLRRLDAARVRETRSDAFGFWFFAMLVSVCVSAIGFATEWAVDNALIPGLVFSAVLAAATAARFSKARSLGSHQIVGRLVAAGISVGLSWQLYTGWYDADQYVPVDEQRQAAHAFIDVMRSSEKPLLVPYHPYYPYLVGDTPHYHHMGLNDIKGAGFGVPPSLIRRVHDQHYGTIILDTAPRALYGFMSTAYRVQRTLDDRVSPQTMAGYPVRPRYVLSRRRSKESAREQPDEKP